MMKGVKMAKKQVKTKEEIKKPEPVKVEIKKPTGLKKKFFK